jgi:hypothetical protein
VPTKLVTSNFCHEFAPTTAGDLTESVPRLSPEDDLPFTYIGQNGLNDEERPTLLDPNLKPTGVWEIPKAWLNYDKYISVS